MRLRRLSECRKREVARYWFRAPGVPFSGFPGFPPSSRVRRGVHFRETADRSSRRLARLCRAFAKDPPLARGVSSGVSQDKPTGGQSTLLSFWPLQRLRSRGSAYHGLATPATVRPQRFARSRRFTPPETARAYFIPVTLMGFGLQGFSLAKSTDFFRRPFLSCRSLWARPVKVSPESDFRGLILPRDRTTKKVVEALSAADALLAFAPLGLPLPPP